MIVHVKYWHVTDFSFSDCIHTSSQRKTRHSPQITSSGYIYLVRLLELDPGPQALKKKKTNNNLTKQSILRDQRLSSEPTKDSFWRQVFLWNVFSFYNSDLLSCLFPGRHHLLVHFFTRDLMRCSYLRRQMIYLKPQNSTTLFPLFKEIIHLIIKFYFFSFKVSFYFDYFFFFFFLEGGLRLIFPKKTLQLTFPSLRDTSNTIWYRVIGGSWKGYNYLIQVRQDLQVNTSKYMYIYI